MTPPDASRLLRERSVTTDDDGRFEIEGIETRGTYLAFDGPPVFSLQSRPLAEAPDIEALEIAVDARCAFRLSLVDPGEADEFALEGAEGGFAPLFYDVEDATVSAAGVDLVDGRSGPASTQEGTHVVVLRRDGREVRRQTMHFPAGGLHVLSL